MVKEKPLGYEVKWNNLTKDFNLQMNKGDKILNEHSVLLIFIITII